MKVGLITWQPSRTAAESSLWRHVRRGIVDSDIQDGVACYYFETSDFAFPVSVPTMAQKISDLPSLACRTAIKRAETGNLESVCSLVLFLLYKLVSTEHSVVKQLYLYMANFHPLKSYCIQSHMPYVRITRKHPCSENWTTFSVLQLAELLLYILDRDIGRPATLEFMKFHCLRLLPASASVFFLLGHVFPGMPCSSELSVGI